MGVSFNVCQFEDRELNGEVIKVLCPVGPDGLDLHTPIGRDEYGDIYPENPWTMNVSEMNAINILKTLGLEFDQEYYCGTLDSGIVVAACDSVLSTLRSIPELDAATPWVETKGVGGCTVYEGGRMEGYLAIRVSELRGLAQIALDRGLVLNYC
jgi:hypothetical protein